MLSMRALWLLAVGIGLTWMAACGGGSSPTSTDTSTQSSTPGLTAEPTPNQTRGGAAGLLVPPLEGPPRGVAVATREDFRSDPDWQLPKPGEVPTSDNQDDPVLNPPATSCPTGWAIDNRPTEGFKICYPAAWLIDGTGYVTSANEDRWYSVGFFDFTDETKVNQFAHVSVYVIPQYTRPLRYTIDCPKPYTVTFAGQPAVVCPSFPPTSPEARIISYHVFANNHDYFVNIATYFEYDSSSGKLTDKTSDDALATALQIVDSFQPEPIPGQPTVAPSQSP
jgi:hypothetical protein